jgi:flagellar hook-basal body complex protein FliE
MRVSPFSSDLQREIGGALGGPKAGSVPSFGDELKASVHEVDQLQHRAEGAMQEGAVQGAKRIDETMIKLEEAEISLRYLVKVRNKALDAYQEVMRMQF